MRDIQAAHMQRGSSVVARARAEMQSAWGDARFAKDVASPMLGWGFDPVSLHFLRPGFTTASAAPQAADAVARAKKEGEELGALSSSPSIAPGGNPMLDKQ